MSKSVWFRVTLFANMGHVFLCVSLHFVIQYSFAVTHFTSHTNISTMLRKNTNLACSWTQLSLSMSKLESIKWDRKNGQKWQNTCGFYYLLWEKRRKWNDSTCLCSFFLLIGPKHRDIYSDKNRQQRQRPQKRECDAWCVMRAMKWIAFSP